MAKGKLGSGSRFAAGVKRLESSEHLPAKNAKAIMAAAGRKKYGAKKMAKWAAAGKRRAEK